MTTAGVGELVRRREESVQTTFLELFFDVVFVFALRALAQVLIKNPAGGAYRTLVLTLASGWMPALTARITSRFNPRRTPVELLVLATMVGALVLAVAVPQAFGKTGLIFAITFLAIQIGRNVFVMILLRGQELQHAAGRGAIWHTATGALWVTGALASGSARTALWTVAVVLTYVGRWFSYPTPGLRHLAGQELPLPASTWPNATGRCSSSDSAKPCWPSDRRSPSASSTPTVAFVVTFLITVLIWRIYVVTAGEDLG